VPGSRAERVVWAPALVGWVGGAGWDITFRDRSRRPGYGWYPLSPHDRYVPSWHASENHLRWLNHHVRPDPHRGRDYRPHGLTVVPQDRFGAGGRVNVPKAPVATVPPALVHNGVNMGIPATSAPPPPANRPHRGNPSDRADRADRNHDRDGGPGRPDRFESNRADRNGDGRPDRLENRFDRPRELDRDRDGGPGRPGSIETARAERDGFVRHRPGQPQPLTVQPQPPAVQQSAAAAQGLPVTSPPPRTAPPGAQGLPVTSPPPHLPSTPQPVTANSPPLQPPAQGWQRPDRPDRREWNDNRRDGRDGREGWNGRDGRDGREGRDGDEHRERRAAPSPAPVSMAAPAQPAAVMMAPRPAAAPASAPPPAPAPVAAPAPAPVQMARPAPPPQQQPAQASAPSRPAVSRVEERKRGGDDHGRQTDR
jgi:hypothetical protein